MKKYLFRKTTALGLIVLFALITFGQTTQAKERKLSYFLNSFLGRNIDEYKTQLNEKAEEIKIANQTPVPETVKGVYMTAYTASTERFDQLVGELKANGGNTVIIDIEHGGGKLAFRPKNEFLKAINPGTDTLNHLPDMIKGLHENGIYAIARQVVFNDPYMGSRKPEWRIKNKWGGLYDYRWLDPSKAGVQNYNLYIMREVAEMGFDEIQFDYIRFPTTNHASLDYHYDEEKFDNKDVINDFLSKARRIADYYGVKLGVDVFGAIVWGDVDWRIVGQNPAEMAEYVDVIYPMVYPSHISPGYFGHNNPYGAPYGFIKNSIDKFVTAVDGKAEIRTWVQGFPLKIPHFGAWFMNDQVRATYDAKGTGFVIWSPGNYYTYSWPSFGIERPIIEEIEEEEVITEEIKSQVLAE